jgi:hypothetical protein
MTSATRAMTFVVRVAPDEKGRLTGIVERVSTGAKERVQTLESIGLVIAQMITTETRSREGSKEERP